MRRPSKWCIVDFLDECESGQMVEENTWNKRSIINKKSFTPLFPIGQCFNYLKQWIVQSKKERLNLLLSEIQNNEVKERNYV